MRSQPQEPLAPSSELLQGEKGLLHPAAFEADVLGLDRSVLQAGLQLQHLGIAPALLVGLQEEEEQLLGQLGSWGLCL